MSDSTTLSMEDFRTMAQKAGLVLTDEELAGLKPMYDHFAGPVAKMHELDLDAEDLAVVFSPDWDPQ
jgi:hypothetical protein